MARAKRSTIYKEPPRYFMRGEAWQRDFEGGVRPPYKELIALIGMLNRGEHIDAKTRGIIAGALTYLSNWLFDEAMNHRRGRRPSIITYYSAAAVNDLHEKHGIKFAAAARAVVDPDVGTDEDRRKLQQSIERTYRTLKANDAFGEVLEILVSKALARLNSRKSGK